MGHGGAGPGDGAATIDQDFTNLPLDFQVLRGNFYRLFELALDAFGIVLIIGLGMAAYRRYLVRPNRLQASKGNISFWDGFPFLTVLLLIVISGFVAEGLRIAEGFSIEKEVAVAGNLEAKVRLVDRMGLRERFHIGPERQDVQLNRIVRGGPVFPAAAWAPVGFALAEVFATLPIARSARGTRLSGGCTRCWRSA